MPDTCSICDREGALYSIRHSEELQAPVCVVCYDYRMEHGHWPGSEQATLTEASDDHAA